MRFAFPIIKKGDTNSAGDGVIAYKTGDFVLVLSAYNPDAENGIGTNPEVHVIISPTLATTPAADGSYAEAPNRSIIFGNSSVYHKLGDLGKTNGSWVAAALA